MNLESEIIVTYKPSGLKMHRSSPDDWGWVEWLEEKLSKKLFLFQRLDLGTSGLALIARTERAAQEWTSRLQNKILRKTYFLISTTSQSITGWHKVESHIIKEKGVWINKPHLPPNSETEFEFIERHGDYQLWKAYPKTGKAHQIRLHAQQLGIPLLGDPDHGGEPFYRLCLHALRLDDPASQQTWTANPPPFFENLRLLEQPDLCALLDAYHQREELKKMGLLNSDSYRLAHQECHTLRIDQFGPQLWAYDYHHPDSKKLVQSFLEIIEDKPTYIREMKNRGNQPNESSLVPLHSPSQRWVAKENELFFQLRADQGLSPGLFLDQRENRSWVFKNSHQKKVLNLFSYTCGFSVAAAAGGANEVVSVDVSSTFLDWGKTNFSLNRLDPGHYEFWSSDVIDFLKRTAKMGRSFDLIVCDPPSFGRSKRGVFKIEKDLSELVALIFPLLNLNGHLLLSLNYEQWTKSEFERTATKNLQPRSYNQCEPPKPGLDFLEKTPILKTVLIKKI
jgi:23S rRNA (cytosine1962-C5)-methyltransferase